MVALRVTIGSWTRKIPATIGVAGLVMLAFAQNPSGTRGGASGLAPGSSLGSNAADRASIQTKPVLEVRDLSGVDCTGATDSSSALNALTGGSPRTDKDRKSTR